MMDTNRLLLRILILFLALGFSALPHFAAASSSPLRQQQPKQTDWPFNDAEFNPRPNAPLSVPIEPLGTELFNSSGGEGRARLLPAPPTAAFASCLASLLPRPITRPRLVPRPDLSNPSATSDILINNYKSQRYRYWQQSHDNTRSPALFVLASTEPQLVAAIKCANRLGLNWVARGGGHSYEASALPEGLNGVVIDLAGFNKLTVSSGKIKVGAGQRLGEMYYRAALTGQLLVAGTCPGNGVSGYLLGGGVGQLTRRFGWGSDHLIQAWGVSSEGQPVVAREGAGATQDEKDLLWALRGGGAGTVVVHTWLVKLYKAPRTMSRCDWTIQTPGNNFADAKALLNSVYGSWKPWRNAPIEMSYVGTRTMKGSTMLRVVGYDKTSDWLTGFMAGNRSRTNTPPSSGSVVPSDLAAILAKVQPECVTYPNWIAYLDATVRARGTSSNLTIGQFVDPTNMVKREYIGYGPVPVRPGRADGGGGSFIENAVLSTIPWSTQTIDALYAKLAQETGSNQGVTTWFLGGQADALPVGWSANPHRNVVALTSCSTDLLSTEPWVEDWVQRAGDDLRKSTSFGGGPNRFYNFVDCRSVVGFGRNFGDLWRAYFGGNAEKLRKIKAVWDKNERLKTFAGCS